MNKYLLLTFLFLNLTSAQQWINQTHGSTFLGDISRIDICTDQVAFINRARTGDAGVSFTFISDFGDAYPNKYTCFHDTIIASTDRGLFLSTNLGESFQKVNSANLNSKMYFFHFLTSSFGYGFNGNFLNFISKTTDGGLTWTDKPTPVHVLDLYFRDSNNGFALSYADTTSQLWQTTDGGDTWTVTYMGVSLRHASFSFYKNIIAINGLSDILLSTDGGLSWNKVIKTPQPYKLLPNENSIVANTHQGSFISTDTLKTWRAIHYPPAYNTAFAYLNTSRMYAGGDLGELYTTSDGGNDWKNVTWTRAVGPIYFIDADYGWIYSEALRHTTDGGTHWDYVYSSSHFSSIHFFDHSRGLAVAYEGSTRAKLIKTTDRGSTWDTIYTWGTSSTWDGGIISFKDSLNGFIIGKTFYYTTTDGGVTWRYDNPLQITGRTIQFVDALNGFITGSVTGYYTSDGGHSWVERPELTGGDFYFIDALNGWKADVYGIYKTTDGGLSFTGYHNPVNQNYSNIRFLNENIGFVKKEYDLYKTTDGGITWNVFFVQGSDYGLYYFALTEDLVWVDVEYRGQIYKYLPGSVTGEINTVPGLPEKFILYQNYPNPFNPVTKIKYAVPAGTEITSVQITVYDLLGRVIATLVNEPKAPGEYEVQFDGSTLPSGVYFCKLTSGNISIVNKLLLLK